MSFQDLFNRPLDSEFSQPSREGPAGGVLAGEEGKGVPEKQTEAPVTGQFVTAQSITNFPAATAVVTLIWGTLDRLFPAITKAGCSVWLGLAVCLLIGYLLYVVNTSDENAPLKGRQLTIARIIAAINTLFLFSASTGAMHLVPQP